MSSLRTVQSSKANGALSKGPATPAGNLLNLLQQHINHFRPSTSLPNDVEFGLVEEMCAARWPQRRAWSMETRMFETQIACPPDGDGLDSTVVAFDSMAATPSLSLLHHYETRLNLTCQRSLRTLIMLRTVKFPNDPSPISEHSPLAEEPPPRPLSTLVSSAATDPPLISL